MTDKKTDNDNLIYVGSDSGEDYYLDLGDDSVRGWSFMGLRPETEEKLREYARESEPEDMLGISRKDFELISTYFDYEKFADDMEGEWLDRYDSQAERENEEGETLYLGFGSGTDIFNYFKKNNITDYESYLKHFEEVGLDEKTFNSLNELVKNAKEMPNSDAEKLAEKKLFTDLLQVKT